MIVRFAHVCDKCKTRGEEYSAFLHCRECMDDICPSCATEYDPDPPGRALCKECAE